MVTDPSNAHNRLLLLTGSTDGTAAGTIESEIDSVRQTFMAGTYATRIRFNAGGFAAATTRTRRSSLSARTTAATIPITAN